MTMEKAYIIIAYNGTEIIDKTPEVEERLASMQYLEERRKRQRRHKRHKWTFRKLAAAYGLL